MIREGTTALERRCHQLRRRHSVTVPRVFRSEVTLTTIFRSSLFATRCYHHFVLLMSLRNTPSSLRFYDDCHESRRPLLSGYIPSRHSSDEVEMQFTANGEPPGYGVKFNSVNRLLHQFHNRRSRILIGTAAMICCLLICAIIGLIIYLIITKSSSVGPSKVAYYGGNTTLTYSGNDFLESLPIGYVDSTNWHNSACNGQCKREGYNGSRPPLLVISLDGFAAKYLKRNIVRSLPLISDCGATAEFVYPSYPSKTFPNHFTIATGLYPEANGIVDNYVLDKDIDSELSSVKKKTNPKYYKGDPIWNVAERNGLKTACLFWVGCSVAINGERPTYDLKYNKSMEFKQRVNQIIDWLSLPANERPALIMAYFDQPDTAGHFQEVDSDVDTQLQGVDLMLNYLLNTLNSKQLLDCINIVILSDHGMKLIENRFYIDDFVNTTGMIVANGVVARIDLNSSSMSIDELMGKLKCINNGKLLREYSRETIPSRYHYSTSNRIGDLVLDGQLGTAIYRDRKSEFLLAADHGYDYLGEDMRAIFFAQGPSIKKKIVLKPFQNIEYYNLFAELLGITRIPPNNGTKGRLDSVLLLGGTSVENRSSVSIADCPSNVVEQIRNRRLQTASCQFLRNEIELSKNSGMLPPNISSLISEQDGYNRSCLVSNNRNELMIVADSTKVAKSPIYTIDILDKTEPNRINEAKSSLSCAWTGNIRRMRNDTFSYLEQFTYRSAIKFGRIVTISGPIFSKDEGLIKSNENASTSNVEQKPSVSHVFRVLIRCTDSLWIPNGLMCKHPSNIRFAAFIMPNRPDDPNCVSSNEYLLAYSVRLRDVELLTHLEFFADRRFIDRHSAVELRTDIMTNIWEV